MLAISLAILLIHAGCAGYGNIKYQGLVQGRKMLADIMADFDDYRVYYSGMSEAFPSGIIFEPDYGDRAIAQKDWIGVKNREKAEKLVRNLERYHQYKPRLYVIVGEDGRNYGYIYTSYTHIVVRQIEPDRIHVYEMYEAPHLKYNTNGAFSNPG